MVTKVNFGAANPYYPEEFIQDFGLAYDAEQGYGWITQDSVGSNDPSPIDLLANARDRSTLIDNESVGGLSELPRDSLIHMQYPTNVSNSDRAELTPGAWEYELANGQYRVTVSVGDPDYFDSTHVINIEGQQVISGFVPSAEQIFTSATAIVEVNDGKLTIDAIGGDNTKLNFVEIAPEELDENDTTEDSGTDTSDSNDSSNSENASDGDSSDNTEDSGTNDVENAIPQPSESDLDNVIETVEAVENGINVNFGPPMPDYPAGFIQDFGAAYSSERGFGWVTQDSAGSDNPTPINLISNGRDRNTLFNDGQGGVLPEPTRDSLIHMQYPTNLSNSDRAQLTPGAWEYDLANGQYEVTVGVGDANYFDSNHVINVEGQALISGFTPTESVENDGLPVGAQAFGMGTAVVEVNDGRLTIDAIGGDNTKINYVSIVPVDTI